MLVNKDSLYWRCPECGEPTPFSLVKKHGKCNACRNDGSQCPKCCGDGFVYVTNPGNVLCLVTRTCECRR